MAYSPISTASKIVSMSSESQSNETNLPRDECKFLLLHLFFFLERLFWMVFEGDKGSSSYLNDVFNSAKVKVHSQTTEFRIGISGSIAQIGVFPCASYQLYLSRLTDRIPLIFSCLKKNGNPDRISVTIRV